MRAAWTGRRVQAAPSTHARRVPLTVWVSQLQATSREGSRGRTGRLWCRQPPGMRLLNMRVAARVLPSSSPARKGGLGPNGMCGPTVRNTPDVGARRGSSRSARRRHRGRRESPLRRTWCRSVASSSRPPDHDSPTGLVGDVIGEVVPVRQTAPNPLWCARRAVAGPLGAFRTLTASPIHGGSRTAGTRGRHPCTAGAGHRRSCRGSRDERASVSGATRQERRRRTGALAGRRRAVRPAVTSWRPPPPGVRVAGDLRAGDGGSSVVLAFARVVSLHHQRHAYIAVRDRLFVQIAARVHEMHWRGERPLSLRHALTIGCA